MFAVSKSFGFNVVPIWETSRAVLAICTYISVHKYPVILRSDLSDEGPAQLWHELPWKWKRPALGRANFPPRQKPLGIFFIGGAGSATLLRSSPRSLGILSFSGF